MTNAEGDDKAPPLLATKLHPPRRRPGTIERPRLTARAAQGDLPALTLVSAPAGFGKTTALAELINTGGDDRLTAWLSLDAGDNDPAIFWSYVIAAVQTVDPSTGSDALSLLRSAEPMASVLSALLNDFAAGGEMVLVLDDYHLIESIEVHDAVSFLVDHLPSNVHLVIAGRADPPLPLPRLRARGDLLELRAADLRFTTEEAASYFNESMGLALTPADIDALESRTEGWIAALQLASLSMQGRDDPSAFVADFAGDDRFVVDYLAEEVLERQPDEVRTFLLHTAVLDRFTGALCDAVTGGRGGKAMLGRLDRANLFLIPLDDRRLWYRYHHLFADVLRARLVDEDPERVDELHRRASAWFEAEGDRAEAITHAMAGHDVDRAARLIELAAPALFQTRQEWTARRWLNALPPEIYADRPVLSIELVGARMVSGEIDGVLPLLDGIDRWLDPEADTSAAIVFDHDFFARLPAQVAVYRAALALIAGDTSATIVHANRALDLAEPSDHLRRGSAAALVGLAEWTTGNITDAIQHYNESIESLTAAGHISDVLGCTIALADMLTIQGQLDDAQRAFESGLHLATTHNVVRGRADMHVGLSEVLLERNDLDDARHHLEINTQLGDQAGLPQNAYRWRLATARVLLAEGDPAAAVVLLEDAERVYNTDMSPPVRPVTSVKVRAQLAVGDFAAARRWAATREVAADNELTYVHEHENITLAQVLLADRATDDAIELLTRLLDAARAGGRSRSVIEILVLLAVALDRGGDSDEAAAALSEALALAEPQHQVRVIADELPALEPLLRAAPTSGPGSGVTRALLASASPTTPRASTPNHELIDPLSDRELDVLRLLRSELSGPEIARELHVSLNTLRTHTKNIYTKLGATNRREAVRRATDLGL